MAKPIAASWVETASKIAPEDRERLAALMIGVPVQDDSGRVIGKVKDASFTNGQITATLEIEPGNAVIFPSFAIF